MADSNNADIRVLVGVEGDAKIDQGSGKIIKDTLVDIASQISKQKLVKISVHLADDAKTTLQNELTALAKELKLNVSTSSGGSGGSGSSGGGGAKSISRVAFIERNMISAEKLWKSVTKVESGYSQAFTSIENTYRNYVKLIQDSTNKTGAAFIRHQEAIKNARAELERMIAAYKDAHWQMPDNNIALRDLAEEQYSGLEKQISTIEGLFKDKAAGRAWAEGMREKVQGARSEMQELVRAHQEVTEAQQNSVQKQIDGIQSVINAMQRQREVEKTHAKETVEKQAKQGSVWKQDNQAQIDELAKLFQQAKDNKIDLGDVSANTQSALTEAKRILERLNDTNGVVTDDMKHDWREVNKDIKKCTTDLTALLKANERTPEASSQALAMQARVQQYLRTVSPQAISEFSSEIKTINSLLSEKTPAANEKARLAFQNLQSAMRSLGYEGGNYITVLYNKIKAFGAYLLSSKLTTVLTSAVNNTIKNVVELNKALTDLQIVTGDTAKASEEMLLTYNKMARDLGATTISVANAGVEWLRQGYSVAETNELIQNSMVLSTVGMMESADAATALTAAMKGYSLEAADAMSVVDKFTSIDMVAATSAGNLATALSKTAANAKLAGLNLNDVIAQLAVVNETMQEDPESTGTFYNTMLSRMAAIKSGRLEDPETGESLSDVEKTLSGLDIKLRDSNEEFRNFGDVLNEVGRDWSSFSSVQQRAIASAFAGTRQQTRFLTLMEGWGDALRYAGIAADSAGTAMQKFETYQESLEAKANRATAAFEKMSDALLPEDVVGTIYDMGTALATLFSTDVGAFGVQITAVLGALVTAGGTLKSFQASGIGKNIIGVAKDLGWPETTGDIIVPIYAKKAA